MKIIVTSASKLDPKALTALKKAVIKKHGQAELELRVDPSVIGGIKVVVGSKAVDATVAGRLDQVKKQLLSQL